MAEFLNVKANQSAHPLLSESRTAVCWLLDCHKTDIFTKSQSFNIEISSITNRFVKDHLPAICEDRNNGEIYRDILKETNVLADEIGVDVERSKTAGGQSTEKILEMEILNNTSN